MHSQTIPPSGVSVYTQSVPIISSKPKSLGLNDVTIHDLRRSLASGMASNNVNIALVKDALNHRDLKTTIAVYARTRKSAVVEAKESLHSSWVAKARQLEKPLDERESS